MSSAYVQPRRKSCALYNERMQPEQKIIAAWLERVRKAKEWSWNHWAKAAGVKAATTLSRAVKDDYDSVTKIETLHALARAAGVPSVLDFLEGNAFSAAALKPILAELLPLAPRTGWTEQDLDTFVEAVQYALTLPPCDPAKPTSQDAYAVAARAAASRLRKLDGEEEIEPAHML